MDADEATLIDARADVQGKLTGKDARILGRFKGEIELTGRLRVGEAARVEAKVKVDVAEIAGQYDGELQAESLVLLEKANVSGTLNAGRLAVKEGALMNGAVTAGTRPARPSKKGLAPVGESRRK